MSLSGACVRACVHECEFASARMWASERVYNRACVSKARLFACLWTSLRVSPSLSVQEVRVTACAQATVSGSVRAYVCAFDKTK